jgi:hypothetical protein
MAEPESLFDEEEEPIAAGLAPPAEPVVAAGGAETADDLFDPEEEPISLGLDSGGGGGASKESSNEPPAPSVGPDPRAAAIGLAQGLTMQGLPRVGAAQQVIQALARRHLPGAAAAQDVGLGFQKYAREHLPESLKFLAPATKAPKQSRSTRLRADTKSSWAPNDRFVRSPLSLRSPLAPQTSPARLTAAPIAAASSFAAPAAVAGAVPAAARTAAGLLPTLGRAAGAGAGFGAVSGGLSSEADIGSRPWLEDVGMSAGVGALASGALSGVGRFLGARAARAAPRVEQKAMDLEEEAAIQGLRETGLDSRTLGAIRREREGLKGFGKRAQRLGIEGSTREAERAAISARETAEEALGTVAKTLEEKNARVDVRPILDKLDALIKRSGPKGTGETPVSLSELRRHREYFSQWADEGGMPFERAWDKARDWGQQNLFPESPSLKQAIKGDLLGTLRGGLEKPPPLSIAMGKAWSESARIGVAQVVEEAAGKAIPRTRPRGRRRLLESNSALIARWPEGKRSWASGRTCRRPLASQIRAARRPHGVQRRGIRPPRRSSRDGEL